MNPDTSPHPPHEDLYAYRDGELAAERRLVIEAHVVGCRACRESIDELSELEAQLRMSSDGVEEGYYERLTERTMERVRAAAPSPRVDRRRSPVETAYEETRVRPRFPWPALTAAMGAAATVVVVVVLLIRQESVWRSAPSVTVLERSAPDAARQGSGADTTVPPPPEPPALGARGAAETAPPAGNPTAPGLADGAGKKDATSSASEDLLAKSEAAQGKLRSRDEALSSAPVLEENEGKRTGEVSAKVAAPQAGVGSTFAREQAASAPVFETTLRRYALPPVWGPGVSDDLVLRAEPALRNLYRTGGAANPLDSARVRLYLAEAARIRLGSARPDSAAAEEITHHYRRAIQLGASDAVTRNTASARLEEFLREIREP
jgi:anti-sigma factor RsiW